jgi:hypothetical protein
MNLQQWCESNWYYLKDRIDFKYGRHWDGLPTVTEILQLIWDPWFQYVMNNYEDKVKEAADKWTAVHKQAEQFFIAKSWVTEMNLNFTKFHTLYNITILKQEKTYYRDCIRWTVDLVWECTSYDWMYENQILNIDYKNSNKHSPKYLLQMAWYKYLNWNNWILVYGKWKLKVFHYNWELDDIWIELVNLFFKLK